MILLKPSLSDRGRFVFVALLVLSLCGLVLTFPNFRSDILYITQLLILFYAIKKASQLKQHKIFLLHASFLMTADFCYYLGIYKFGWHYDSLEVFFSSSLLYIGAYILAIWASARGLRFINSKYWIKLVASILPIFAFLVVSAAHYFEPLILQMSAEGLTIANLSVLLTAISCVTCACISYLRLYDIGETKKNIYFSGVLLMSLTDWGIQVEYLVNKNLLFSFYDFLWFTGVLFVAYGLSGHQSPKEPSRPIGNSLIQNLRLVFFVLAILVASGVSYLLNLGVTQGMMVFVLSVGSSIPLFLFLTVYIDKYLDKQNRAIARLIETDFSESAMNEIKEEIPHELYFGLIKLISNYLIESKIRSQKELEVKASNYKLASQVAHDIRSPLAALKVTLGTLPEMSEEKRILLRNSIHRIRDIANNLLKIDKPTIHPHVPDNNTVVERKPQMLSAAIESLISEKRVQYRGRSDVVIDFYPEESSLTTFCQINLVEFKRVLSNLINNSVEAIQEKGEVKVELFTSEGFAVIKVIDNGPGIDMSIANRVGEPGLTKGKEGTESGSGLGLYLAKSTVESFGGKFSILPLKSKKGTEASIELPMVPPPKWLATQLVVKPNSHFIVLDDEPSIHDIWKTRFDRHQLASRGLKFLSFSSATTLQNWLNTDTNGTSRTNDLFLIDFELVNSSETGLDLIKRTGLSRAILITSRHEEEHIQTECEQFKVALLPKSLSWTTDIVIKDN
jgi:signal transduction histidine kinase